MSKLLKWSFTAALAGFLFGFDTVVISGADQKLQTLWNTTDIFHGAVVMSMALWGTVFGAVFGGFPTKKIGRKNTLLWIGIFFSISAIGSALANDPITFAIFRFVGGIGVGISGIAAPAYISEIAPQKNRGKLVGLYQFSIVIGILIAFISNYLLSGLGQNDWRFMIGVELIPALIFTFLVISIPKSPRWLFLNNRQSEAEKIIRSLYSTKEAEGLILDITKDNQNITSSESIFNKKYSFIVMLAFLIAAFNQLSGINAFLYYAPRIFEEAGLGQSIALLNSVGIGLTNVIFTYVGINLIDRLGRRTLMYIGSFGYIVSLSLISLSFFLEWEGIFLPLFFFLFIASHAIGQGAIIWVYISEIFPNNIRSYGQSFGVSTHWILAAIIPSFIPFLFGFIGPGFVFSFFALMMVFQLLFVHFIMPETKGISLEDLSKKLIKIE
ncbi:MAG: MFS transporter [Flavobacteriales bacterium]|nr:MAG: MFS transporter [Flavobacteriales bacterium]|tara:strand:+ start:168 stop:1487 length:1320 start_codon:yes stop_codon:yes gene_type:complete